MSITVKDIEAIYKEIVDDHNENGVTYIASKKQTRNLNVKTIILKKQENHECN